jgi:hypothetical protein
MNTSPNFKVAIAVAAFLALPVAQAQTMSKSDYNAGKARISADLKSDQALCAPLHGNAKVVCHEEAKAHDRVARAELEYGHTGKVSDRNKVLVVKAETNYAVAMKRCDDKSRNAKPVCLKEAKAVEVKALADARMAKEIGEARTDAANAKRDADYTVAVEKCDAIAGDAKAGCLQAAKARFGKS